jgi:hypothetical protein
VDQKRLDELKEINDHVAEGLTPVEVDELFDYIEELRLEYKEWNDLVEVTDD